MMLLPDHFHFLRPEWFAALIPMLLLIWLFWRQKLLSRSWRGVVDPKLLPHLLIGKAVNKQPWSMIIIAIAGILAITALAGPVWNKLEQPVFRQQSALVVLLDLSRSMDATDIKPSRLLRAKLKLHDILKRRKEGQTAIITYAANPFVVTPLTTDTKTISSQLPGFSTDLMPVQGSRVDRAIEKGIALLKQAGMKNGAIMLVTDGIEGAPTDKLNAQIQQLLSEGYRLLVLGVGTEEGAPIPQANGGFFKNAQGNIVLPKLESQSLYKIAQQGQGIYQSLTADDHDINSLLSIVDDTVDNNASQLVDDMKSDQWQEQGYWLILPLLLLAAFGFRRGYLLALVIIILPIPEPAYALEWNELWSTENQRAQRAYDKGDNQQAAELFNDPEWRAASNYKRGQHEAALKDLEKINNAQSLYNKGNTLAQMQRFPEALSAYEEALKHDPDLEDAKFNRDLIKKWMEENQSQNQNQDKNKKSESDSSKQDENKNPDNAQDQKSEDQQSQDSQSDKQGDPQSGQQADQNNKDDAASAKNDLQQNKTQEEKPANAQQNTDPEKDNKAESKPESDKDQKNAQAKMATKDELNSESDQATEQWLRRIPDDPAGLWRRKFLYQYQKQYQSQKEEDKPW